jgi:hypothetical protein
VSGDTGQMPLRVCLFDDPRTGGEDHGDVGATESVDRGDRIDGSGVDHVSGAELSGEGQFLLGDVHSDGLAAADQRVLLGEVAEPTDPKIATRSPGATSPTLIAL